MNPPKIVEIEIASQPGVLMEPASLRRVPMALTDPQQALANVGFQAVNPDTANYLTEHRWAIIAPVPPAYRLMLFRRQ